MYIFTHVHIEQIWMPNGASIYGCPRGHVFYGHLRESESKNEELLFDLFCARDFWLKGVLLDIVPGTRLGQ